MSLPVPFPEGWFLCAGPEAAAPDVLSLPWISWGLDGWSQHLGTELFEIRTNVGVLCSFTFAE